MAKKQHAYNVHIKVNFESGPSVVEVVTVQAYNTVDAILEVDSSPIWTKHMDATSLDYMFARPVVRVV